MEFRQLILFTALGLTLVMLWTSWQEFQARHLEVNAQINSVNNSDIPAAPANTTPSFAANGADNEIPTVSGQGANVAPQLESSQVDGGEIITVTTDLLNVQIDSKGGDIVRVELKAHPTSVKTPDEPYVLAQRSPTQLYVAESGLFGTDNDLYPNHNTNFQYQATAYDLSNGDSIVVPLTWVADNDVVFEKTLTFHRDSYRIDVAYNIINNSAETWTGFEYAHLKRSVPPSDDGGLGILGGARSFVGGAIFSTDEHYEKIDFEDMRENPLNRQTESGWVAMLEHYFVSAWLPEGNNYTLYSGSNNSLPTVYRLGYRGNQPITVEPGNSTTIKSAFYTGPKEQARLNEQNAEGLDLTVDFGILTVLANPLFYVLRAIHSVLNNWGWSIIVLTLLVKLMFFPLSAMSYKSMAKMRKLQPRMATLKERFADDKQKFQQEMMKLYKTEKVNPAGGCLPIMVQIPVFIALYWVLLESVELRQASFFWMKDLSLRDPFFILPVIMGITMFVQQKLNPAPLDPIQAKVMTALPIVFTVFFLFFPAGLVLYWVVNNSLSILQQWYITRKYS